jgi:repressor LexA
MSFNEYLIQNKEATYILEVKGDSMIDAGILEGDLVVVERTNAPRVGDIVIADVDGAWTMKFLRKRGETFYLVAANPRYKPIVATQELRIVAVVIAVVRKYKRP